VLQPFFLIRYENEMNGPEKDGRRKKKKSEPDRRNGAGNISSMSGYIGLRENRNGPERINVAAVAVGQIEFFFCETTAGRMPAREPGTSAKRRSSQAVW
jgi:hypothetical protein